MKVFLAMEITQSKKHTNAMFYYCENMLDKFLSCTLIVLSSGCCRMRSSSCGIAGMMPALVAAGGVILKVIHY